MADPPHADGHLSGLSGVERREALEELVASRFKEALLMGADEAAGNTVESLLREKYEPIAPVSW
ncbi:hypothetical protein ACF07L_07680 [Streptomyces anulatus]|uniref:hypothetical protein n=1 Tax=Streptomyces anulatus TaxID=1892 RepID=UPI0036F9B164